MKNRHSAGSGTSGRDVRRGGEMMRPKSVAKFGRLYSALIELMRFGLQTLPKTTLDQKATELSLKSRTPLRKARLGPE